MPVDSDLPLFRSATRYCTLSLHTHLYTIDRSSLQTQGTNRNATKTGSHMKQAEHITSCVTHGALLTCLRPLSVSSCVMVSCVSGHSAYDMPKKLLGWFLGTHLVRFPSPRHRIAYVHTHISPRIVRNTLTRGAQP